MCMTTVVLTNPTRWWGFTGPVHSSSSPIFAHLKIFKLCRRTLRYSRCGLQLVMDNMELTEGSIVHYPIEKFPANFITLVGSRVEVLTVNQMTYSGNIYSMDPITGRSNHFHFVFSP